MISQLYWNVQNYFRSQSHIFNLIVYFDCLILLCILVAYSP